MYMPNCADCDFAWEEAMPVGKKVPFVIPKRHVASLV